MQKTADKINASLYCWHNKTLYNFMGETKKVLKISLFEKKKKIVPSNLDNVYWFIHHQIYM